MTRLLINADDFGYSEAVNHGIIKSHVDGVLISTTLMTNMPAAKHAVDLSRHFPELFIGQHTNIVIGKPCAPGELVSELIDKDGNFNIKDRLNKGESLNVDQVVFEVRAQAEQFKTLLGYYPTHIEGHAVHDSALYEAIAIVAKELNSHYVDLTIREGKIETGLTESGYEIPESPDVMFYKEKVTYDYWSEDQGNILSKNLVHIHSHPGYLDQYLIENSSYSFERAKEVEILCSDQLKNWININQVELITFADIKKVGRK